MNLNTIYNQDCLSTMANLSDNSVDLIICSPPYDSFTKKNRDYNGYIFDFEKTAKELYRITKTGGVVIWVVDCLIDKNSSEDLIPFRQAIYFKDSVGFLINDTMIYGKNNPLPRSGPRLNQSFEYIFPLTKGKPRTFNALVEKCKYKGIVNYCNRGSDNNREYRKGTRKETKKAGNILMYSIGGGISAKDKFGHLHPAIFPEQLAKDQVLMWSNEGDIVFDPFLGSGTTMLMALLNKRQCFGCDISTEYCVLAKNRIESRTGIIVDIIN